MSRQDEPTDRIGTLTGVCVRCDAREIDKKWDKERCSSPPYSHCHIEPVLRRARAEINGARAAIAVAASLPAPARTTTRAERDELISRLAIGLASALFGFFLGLAVAGGHL